LRDLEVGGIGGEQPILGDFLRIQAELRVDVERDAGAARGPNHRFDHECVRQEVVTALGAVPGGLQSGLLGLSGEVVGGQLLTLDSSVQILVSAIVGGVESVLPTIGIVDVEVDLAVLATVGNCGSRTDGSNIVVEEEGENLLSAVGGIGYGASRASATSIGEGIDVNIIGIGSGRCLCEC